MPESVKKNKNRCWKRVNDERNGERGVSDCVASEELEKRTADS